MATKLKRNWTEADVAELRRILREFQRLSVGVHPGIMAFDQYQAALATLIWFGQEMTGSLDFGREKHSISEGYRSLTAGGGRAD